MIFTKKGAAVAVAALALGASAAFAEVTFTNTVKSGIIDLTFMQPQGVQVEFAGVFERIEAEYTSEKLDFGVDAELGLENEPGPTYMYYNPKDNERSATKFFDLKWWDLDFYLEFRPWDFLTFFLSDDIYTPGSYLPVNPMYMASGNMGSDVGVLVSPINGLRISAGLDVISYFGGDPTKDDDVWIDEKINSYLPKLNAGIDYTYKNIWSVGLVARNILNWSPRIGASIGLFGSFTGIEGWAFYTGVMFNNQYDYYWDVNDQYPRANIIGLIHEYRVEGWILFDLGFSAWNDKLSVDFDLVTNFGMNKNLTEDFRTYPMMQGDTFDHLNVAGTHATMTENNWKALRYAHYFDGFDLYAGLRGKYDFSKNFSADITLKGIADFSPRVSATSVADGAYPGTYVDPNYYSSKPDGRGAVFEVIPTVKYTLGRHTFSAGADVMFADMFAYISFPVSWVYKF